MTSDCRRRSATDVIVEATDRVPKTCWLCSTLNYVISRRAAKRRITSSSHAEPAPTPHPPPPRMLAPCCPGVGIGVLARSQLPASDSFRPGIDVTITFYPATTTATMSRRHRPCGRAGLTLPPHRGARDCLAARRWRLPGPGAFWRPTSAAFWWLPATSRWHGVRSNRAWISAEAEGSRRAASARH